MGNIPNYILVLVVVYGIVMLIFTIIFFANWIRLRNQVNQYLGYGFISAGILLLFEVLLVISEPLLITSRPIATLIATDLFAMLRLIAFTVVGIYYARKLEIPILPILAPNLENHKLGTDLSKSQTEELAYSVYAITTYSEGTASPRINSSNQPLNQNTHPSNRKSWLVTVMGMVTSLLIFSTLLLYFTGAETSSLIRGLQNQLVASESFSMVGILIVLQFAFIEEILFRLGIQNYLSNLLGGSNTAHWIAIIISTSIWTLAHAGMLTPEWVKFVQIFFIGLGIGWLNKNYGIEACIITHCLFNIIMYLIGLQLFT